MVCGKAKGSAQAEDELGKRKKELEKELRVLLLGTGESGKSTIFKQMKIIHLQGFQPQEMLSYKPTIWTNIIRCMRSLVQASHALNIPIQKNENKEKAQKIANITDDQLLNVQKVWSQQLGQDIMDLWGDEGIKSTFARKSEFQLEDSAEYYFNELSRINKEDWTPTEQDILRSRVKTTGIVELEFTLNDKKIKLIDVGGQRNERKKWIHCFEGVTAMIFVTSLSEYDQKCYEDNETNRTKESLLLFDEIINSRWFAQTNVIVFFNKDDLFKEKIKKVDLKVSFPDYDGGCDYEKAKKYLVEKYLSLRKDKKKNIYTHFTTATDTDIMKKVFAAIKDIILQKALLDGGLITK